MRRAVVLLALLLPACSSAGDEPAGPRLPAASTFTAGTCQSAAPHVLAVGRSLPQLRDEGPLPQELQASLRDIQDRLRPYAQAPEATQAAAFAALVESMGAVRIRAVGNTYEPSLGSALERSYDEVLQVCTSGE